MHKINNGSGMHPNRFVFNLLSCYPKVIAFKSDTTLIQTRSQAY
jgi:hypothetical protein